MTPGRAAQVGTESGGDASENGNRSLKVTKGAVRFLTDYCGA
jgi:hypothetical protein